MNNRRHVGAASGDALTGDVLVGRWSLRKFISRNGPAVNYPVGEAALGEILYTAAGGVSTHIVAAGRRRFESDGLWDGSAGEYAAAFATYIGYYGTFEVHGDAVVHHIVASSFPNWAGSRQVRYAEVAGDTLVLRTEPMNVAGSVVVNELHWCRVE
jgi:hypothetical protein